MSDVSFSQTAAMIRTSFIASSGVSSSPESAAMSGSEPYPCAAASVQTPEIGQGPRKSRADLSVLTQAVNSRASTG